MLSFQKETIKELYKDHTLQEIGNIYGLSRERIRQILKKEFGITSRINKKYVKCSICPRHTLRLVNQLADEEKKNTLCSACLQSKYYHIKHPNAVRKTKQFEIKPCIICHKDLGRIKKQCRRCYNRIRLKIYYGTEKGKAAARLWKKKNRLKVNQYHKKYVAKNKEKIAEMRKKYYRKIKLREKLSLLKNQ